MDTEAHTGKMPCEVGGRGQDDASIRQSMSKIASNQPKTKRGCGIDFLSQPSEAINPANTLISEFQPPELGDNKCLLLKPPVCGVLLWQPQQMDMWTMTVLQWLGTVLLNTKLTECWGRGKIMQAHCCWHLAVGCLVPCGMLAASVASDQQMPGVPPPSPNL